MAHIDINAVRCEALFASVLQRSDEPSVGQIQAAVAQAVRRLGSRGCAAQVAQEFGDHPEIAVARMCWARHLVETAYGAAHHSPAHTRSTAGHARHAA